jgi:hypothetical protein
VGVSRTSLFSDSVFARELISWARTLRRPDFARNARAIDRSSLSADRLKPVGSEFSTSSRAERRLAGRSLTVLPEMVALSSPGGGG